MLTNADPGGTNAESDAAALVHVDETGLAAWMERAVGEIERTRRDLTPDAVHDLRVALRRCLSMADIHMTMDPFEGWKDMKREGRRLFKRLGDLRDAQIMREWAGRLFGEQDPAGQLMDAYLQIQEAQLRRRAAKTLDGFNLKKWQKWRSRLPSRLPSIPPEDPVFLQLALERWQAARELHHQALRNRSRMSFHRLRIGLKHFRYTVENYLPHRHELWGIDLKQLQDVLGEYHDLHILWQTARQIGALQDMDVRAAWRARLEDERGKRLQVYREKALGKGSVWSIWRSGLPSGKELEQAAERRIRLWAAFRDRDFARTEHVADLAAQLYEGLEQAGSVAAEEATLSRVVLQAASIMCNVGLAVRNKKSHKASYRMISAADPPLGFPPEIYRLAALAALYHRGAFPQADQRHFMGLSGEHRRAVLLASAILRLADAMSPKGDARIHRLAVGRTADAILISAAGYLEADPLARRLAAARHPLEVVLGAPVLIRTLGD